MQSVLFVDDDPMVLRGIERQFEDELDVVTTTSAAEALQILEARTDLPLVVTDMDMPGMCGLDFIERAREVATDARFVMLTGNRDLEVASAAVNRCSVFRLLHKPCGPETLSAAIEAGIADWEANRGQRDLLHHTFVGAVSTLTSMLDRGAPELTTARDQIVDAAKALREGAGIEDQWELCLAAKLCLLGFRALDLSGDPFVRGMDPVGENQRLFVATAGKAAGVIEKIPRLANVAAMIRTFPTADGSICNKKPRTDAARASVGGSLLRVTTLSWVLLRHGVDPEGASREVAELLPETADCLLRSIAMMPDNSHQEHTKSLTTSELRPGMVVARSVSTPAKGSVLRAGKRLDERLIEKITDLLKHSGSGSPVEVTQDSWLAFREVPSTQFTI